MRTSKEGSVFDPAHSGLDQHIYREITPRRSIVKFVEHKIYNAFAHQFGFDCKPYLSLYLTGSLTTIQYSDESDCDISIFVDYANWPSGIIDSKLFRTSLIAFIIDRLDGIHLPGTQHPLQVFVVAPGITPEDMYKPGLRSAWSFKYKTWFVEPEFDRAHDVKKELPGMYLRAAAIGRKLEAMIDVNPHAAIEMYKRLHKKRARDQQKGRGDFSEGNVIYKWLAHEGLFDRLRGLGLHIAARQLHKPLEGTIVLPDGEIIYWTNDFNDGQDWWVLGDNGSEYSIDEEGVSYLEKSNGHFEYIPGAYSPELDQFFRSWNEEEYWSEATGWPEDQGMMLDADPAWEQHWNRGNRGKGLQYKYPKGYPDPPKTRFSSPWINEYGEAIGYDEDDPPEGEKGVDYEWTDEDVPEEWDAFIADDRSGYYISLEGKGIEGYGTWEEAVRGLAAAMDKAGYYPNVWHANERGDPTLIDILEELKNDPPWFPVGTQVIEYYTGYDMRPTPAVVESVKRDQDYEWVYTLKDEEGQTFVLPQDEDYIAPYDPEIIRQEQLADQNEFWADNTLQLNNGQQMMTPTDPTIWGEDPWVPPKIPGQKKPRFSAIPCTTEFGNPVAIIETPWPGKQLKTPLPEQEPVNAKISGDEEEKIPFSYSEQLYGWKMLRVAIDGTLVSPTHHADWPVGEPLRAPEFDPSQNVRNAAGIHTVEQEHWTELYTYMRADSVLVKCSLHGQTIRGDRGVYRSQGAMPVLAVGNNKELLLKVANKYGIDTELVGSRDSDTYFTSEEHYGWKIVGPARSQAGEYQGFQFDPRKNLHDETTLHIIDAEGDDHGTIHLDIGGETVEAISTQSTFADEVVKEYFDDQSQQGNDFTWDQRAEQGVNLDAEGKIIEHWESELSIDDLEDLVKAVQEINHNSSQFTELDGEEEGRYELAEDKDQYGLRYWDYIRDYYAPRQIDFSPQRWQELLYQTIEELKNPSEESEWSPEEIQKIAEAFYYLPTFLENPDCGNWTWRQYDLQTFFASNLRQAYLYTQQSEAPQAEQLFSPDSYEQQQPFTRNDVTFFLNYLAQLAGTGKFYAPNKTYDYSDPKNPVEKGYSRPWEGWIEPEHMFPPQSPLVQPGGFSHWHESRWELPDNDLPIQILYNFDKDLILLGNNPTTAADEEGIHVQGEYDGRNVILYHEKDHWINASYFKKLWKHSFPTRPIHNVYLHNLELVPTNDYRRPKY